MSDPIIESPSGAPEETSAPDERRREPIFNLPGIIVALVATLVAIQLVRSTVLTGEEDMALVLRTAFIPIRYSGRYALDLYVFTSPVTYAFLHGGWLHLAVNAIWLAAFGSPLANRMGAWRFLAFWLFASLAAAFFHYLTHVGDPLPVVGASGAISGMMGTASRLGLRIGRIDGRTAFAGPLLSFGEVLRSRQVLTFLVAWMAVNLVAGLGYFTPGVDSPIAWQAHIGGFLAGFFFAAPFLRRPHPWDGQSPSS